MESEREGWSCLGKGNGDVKCRTRLRIGRWIDHKMSNMECDSGSDGGEWTLLQRI